MSSKSIVFVDSRVSNYQSLIDNLTEPADVFVLNSESDGLAQMAADLQGRTGIDAIHVISHGSTGALYLGSTVLDSGNLSSYGLQLDCIGRSLTPTGDILLYGCNVAQGEASEQFINALMELTGADVAASDDLTGPGGDVQLEQATGDIEAQPLALTGLATRLAQGGIVTTNFSDRSFDSGESIALQPDGKILVAGTSGFKYFALVRYNSDGTLDTTFSSDGKLTTDIIAGGEDRGSSVTVQANGKILVAGYTGDAFSDRDFALVRYNSDGSLDTTFSGDGKLTTSFGTGMHAEAQSVTVQADGKILVAGSIYNYSSSSPFNGDIALVRYNSDGSLDTTFSGDGKLTTDIGTNDGGSSVIAQPDGRILVVGHSYTDGYPDYRVLVRYNSDGSLDSTFSGDGKVTTGGGNGASGTLQADGKILVAGTSSNRDFALVRYNSDGSLDTTFSGDGQVSTDLGAGEYGTDVNVLTDGKILVAGASYIDDYYLALARYNSDGSLDTTFSGDGKLTAAIGNDYSPGDITVQPDGKILVAGATNNGSSSDWDYDFLLARYNPDGTLDTQFGIPNNAPLSKFDNFVVVEFASANVIGSGAGNDTYLLSPGLLPAGINTTITDTLGSNSIQLAPGLLIASSKVASTALQLTLSNGSVVNVLGADQFSYEAGGNTSASVNQPDVSYATFVQQTLGVTLPINGSVVTGGAVQVSGSNHSGQQTVLPVGVVTSIAAGPNAETFYLDAVTARMTVADTQITLSNFATASDVLQLDLPTASGRTTLGQLSGTQGVLAQSNSISVNTLVNLGNDADGGVIALTLQGITDPALVQVEVV